MLDVRDVTKFDRTTEELEEFLLFCFLNHGKLADMQAKKLEEFLEMSKSLLALETSTSPFAVVRSLVENDLLEAMTRKAKLGQYKNCVDPGFKQIAFAELNLKTCSLEELEKIKGISFKSSRYFVLHSRPNQQIAVLDRHILKWMREIGYEKAPKNPPQNYKKYQYWEEIFLKEAKDRNLDVADLDLEIWKSKQRISLKEDAAKYQKDVEESIREDSERRLRMARRRASFWNMTESKHETYLS